MSVVRAKVKAKATRRAPKLEQTHRQRADGAARDLQRSRIVILGTLDSHSFHPAVAAMEIWSGREDLKSPGRVTKYRERARNVVVSRTVPYASRHSATVGDGIGYPLRTEERSRASHHHRPRGAGRPAAHVAPRRLRSVGDTICSVANGSTEFEIRKDFSGGYDERSVEEYTEESATTRERVA